MDVWHALLEIGACEKISGEEMKLLKTAALFHDSGFIITYRGHENASCNIVEECLPQFDYNAYQISRIKGMIMATRLPQDPQNHLEEILCDADLDYLGRKDFYAIADTLYQEFLHHGIVDDPESWNRLQLSFLEKHQYFTEFSTKYRKPLKNRHMEEIRKMVGKY